MAESETTAEGAVARKRPNGRTPAWRERLRTVVEAERFQWAIVGVIVTNAVIIGLETSPWAMERYGDVLRLLDGLALAIFVVEIAMKLAVYRLGFFRNPWNVFDFIIVGIALVPAGEGLTVLRALRILRALRLLSVIPKMRMVVQGLLAAIPAMGSVIALLALVFYIFAVMATKLFGGAFPDWFGSVGASLFSLFQVMTLESWSMGIVRPVMEVFPYAWAFFVPFILVTSFAVLNLFIAIIVNSMHDVAEEAKGGDTERQALENLRLEIRELRKEMAALGQAPRE